jgi:hypothetical protein
MIVRGDVWKFAGVGATPLMMLVCLVVICSDLLSRDYLWGSFRKGNASHVTDWTIADLISGQDFAGG